MADTEGATHRSWQGIRNRYRPVILVAADAFSWCIAILVATALRYYPAWGSIGLRGAALILPWAVVAQVVIGFAFGLYLGRWRLGSFDELSALWSSAVVATVVVVVADLWLVHPRMVPLGAAIGGGVGAFVLMGSLRYGWRVISQRRRRGTGEGAARTLVFGAGEGGYQAILAMRSNSTSPYFPVGLLDDDPAKRKLHILGVRVLGDRSRLAGAAGVTQADTLLIAIPSASSELIEAMRKLALEAGLAIKVLPPVAQLYGDHLETSDIRDVTIEDMLGRHQVRTDLDAIAAYLTGKRVLVTGAGGSIGSELCRQIVQFAPAELMMLDRDESALHALQLSIEGRALLDSPALILADIRDREVLRATFGDRRPQVVFHAAALKHLTLLERHPAEAVKTNIWGTMHVLEASVACGVDRFVNVSTDKAADPISVLGYSKRVAERLTAGMACRGNGDYLSVRFGNVLGSRGSMLETFRAQVRNGGPLTVTDPEVTRYFMTIPEAVQLVIQAGAIGASGEALVLDMGKPVRIADVAKRLAAEASRPVRIVYTGLRPGEKCHEVLLGTGEQARRRVHPLVTHVAVLPLGRDALDDLDLGSGAASLVRRMSALCVEGEMIPEALN